MSNEHFTAREVTRVPKPWGYELIWGRTERYVGKVLHVNRGESLSRQYHNVKDETLYLISGKIRLTLKWEDQERTVTMNVGDSYHIPPRLIHQIEAIEDSDIVEVSTPELDDVVRLEDRYGRAGTTER